MKKINTSCTSTGRTLQRGGLASAERLAFSGAVPAKAVAPESLAYSRRTGVAPRPVVVKSTTVPLAKTCCNRERVKDLAKTLHYRDQRELMRGRKARPLVSSSSSMSGESSVAWGYLRIISKVCKVFVGVCLAWIFIFGQPSKFLDIGVTIYQGFHCGWSAEVENPYTCDR